MWQISGALVYPADGPVKGICHFLGGAFACAAPQVVYPLMIDSLVASGYTVIATPFAITFKHRECAIKLHKVCVIHCYIQDNSEEDHVHVWFMLGYLYLV